MVVAHGCVLAYFGWTFALSMRSKGKTSSQVVIHKTRGEEEGKVCCKKSMQCDDYRDAVARVEAGRWSRSAQR